MKIRDRLTLTFSFTALLAVTALGVSVYLITAEFHKEEFFKRLSERVYLTEQIFLEEDQIISDAVRNRFMQRLDDEKEYVITLQPSGRDSIDRMFYAGLADDLLKNDSTQFWLGKSQGVARHYSLPSGEYAVIVTAVDVFGQTKLDFLGKMLFIGGFLCILSLIIVSRLSIQRALMPLVRKIEKARKISASQLGLRLNVFNPKDELGQLAITFNNMLDRLQAAFESQKQFVSNASHEIRNPLTAIIGEAELLLSRPRTAAEYQEALATILSEAKRLNSLTQQLLELAKAESMTKLPDLVPVGLDTILLEVIEKFPLERFQLELEPCDGECLVASHPFLLHTALSNLVENALKYSGEKPVTIQFNQDHQGYRIVVKDQGIGIPKEDMDKIYQPLFRARNARHLKGHGIGLPLAKRIIDLHHGVLQVTSAAGQGTVATVFLPGF